MNPAALTLLLCILVSLHQCWSESDSDKIIISTYNLWNVMFNWEIRKQHIADLVMSTKYVCSQNNLSFIPMVYDIYCT